MARLKIIIELETERLELARYAHGDYMMDTMRFLLPYARQSTEGQYFKSMVDKTEQSSKLLEHARSLEWPLDKILPVFVENDVIKRKRRHQTLSALMIGPRSRKHAHSLMRARLAQYLLSMYHTCSETKT